MSVPLLLRRLERDDDLFPGLQVFQPNRTVGIFGLQNLRGQQSEVLLVAIGSRYAVYGNLETALLSLRLILCRMRQGPLVLENLTEIPAVDPATTGRTSDEMLHFVLRRIANALAEVFSTRKSPGLRSGPGHGLGIVSKCRSRDRWWARQTKPVRSRLSWDIDRLQKP